MTVRGAKEMQQKIFVLRGALVYEARTRGPYGNTYEGFSHIWVGDKRERERGVRSEE